MEDSKELVEFEKARFEYCMMMHDREYVRQQNLEKKSQFYLSFVTLFLGAIFIGSDFLGHLKKIFSPTNTSVSFLFRYGVHGAIIGLGVCLFAALLLVMQSVRIRNYTNVYPENLKELLFTKSSEYLGIQNIQNLFKENALSCAIAVENNKTVNDKKALWIRFVELALLVSVMFFAVCIAIIFYMLLP
jgi:hypothetical protein